ncbi:MAG: sugar ABC transporter ATP-binding protein, partial [Syntrophomonadaceae bacterium]|nr:sugar ABC transporter ATP-binding protein [Syntrophomonadaceae bacterium]
YTTLFRSANGSGKSTLMNILFGSPVIQETGGFEGEIRYLGNSINLMNCAEAIDRGIGMVHQEFALIPDMTIGENIKLGREKTYPFTDRLFGRKYSFINKNEDYAAIAPILQELGIALNARIKIMNLSTNTKQFVEIAREIARSDLRLLLLDEPTAVLNKSDALKLMEILRGMAHEGIGILFISHRLEEIKHICDKVTVFRDGKLVSQYGKSDISINNLAHDMIGHLVSQANAQKRKVANLPAISFNNYFVEMPGEEIKNLDLEVLEGEILGLTSLSGHGKLALGYGMMGFYPTGGEVIYENQRIGMDAKENILKGIYVLPDDRQDLGILPQHSLEDNIIFTGNQIKNMFTHESTPSFLGFIDRKKTHHHVNQLIQDFDIKCSSSKQRVKELSGGNQQKVCIARALTVNPKLLFVAEPTRGVDIAAKEKILQMLIDINRRKQTTIIIASSELDELKRVCDRIAIMVDGRLFKILSPNSSDIEFGLALSGEEGVASAKH